VEQIEDAIVKGELKPQDRLPSEMKLSQMFSASRSSVREALRILEQKGLISIKRGALGGAVVRRMDTTQVTEGFTLLLKYKHVRFDQMAEFREVLEGGLTALAAQRADDQSLDRLKSILKKARQVLDHSQQDWQSFYDQDIAFHVELAKITENPVFTSVLCMLHQDILGADEKFAVYDHELMEQNYTDLANIILALEKKDPEEASRLAKEHVRRFNGYMKAQEEMFAMPVSDQDKKVDLSEQNE
jgi:DNA-binding FadR family transcriptional regulator